MKKIVCIEDNIEIIQLITLFLKQQQNVKIIGITDWEDSLKKIGEIQPDLVILDYNLPNLAGWHIHREIRENEQLKRVPVLVLISHLPDYMIDLSLQSSTNLVDDYVTLPFGHDFVPKIKQLLKDI